MFVYAFAPKLLKIMLTNFGTAIDGTPEAFMSFTRAKSWVKASLSYLTKRLMVTKTFGVRISFFILSSVVLLTLFVISSF